MSYPFGGHPYLIQYINWVRENHDFKAKSGYGADSTGKTHIITKIYKEGGPSVVIAGTAQNERLSPSMVGNLDRRLKIDSPWFSIDADDGTTPPPAANTPSNSG